MMMFEDIFQEYESLVAKADSAYQEMQNKYGSCIKCDIQCDDCCNSVFGLFLIESAYLNHHFNKLDRRNRREVAARGEKADKDLLELEKKLQVHKDNPDMQARAMASERIRCPLLSDEGKCVVYSHRPITCRVYGIPTVINGKIHACWKAGFEKGKSYPAFNLDGAYGELYRLSRGILERLGKKDMDRASLLVSVSKSIMTPFDNLMTEDPANG